MRRITVLNPFSAWGVGHVQTCINILMGMQRAGGDVRLDLIRSNVDMGDLTHRAILPAPVSRLSLARFEPRFRRMVEQNYLSRMREGDLAWLWPAVSVETAREVHRRGNPIILEGINTRIASARRILDAAYLAEGLELNHGAKAEAAEREEELLSLASHYFSPSPGVDAALLETGSHFTGRVMKSSYGAWTQEATMRPDPTGRPLTVLFVGTVCIRKNLHGLLRAWSRAALPDARLVLCGDIEPAISRICADELALPSVEALGHVRDVASVYRSADVFVMPSLEEGDPQVTYEAASFGLPVIASPMGGGRLAERTNAVFPIDPYDIESISAAIVAFVRNPDLRQEYAARSLASAPRFDWNEVGRERLDLLRAAFDGLRPEQS